MTIPALAFLFSFNLSTSLAHWSDNCPSGTTADTTCKQCGTDCAFTQTDTGVVTLYGNGKVGGLKSKLVNNKWVYYLEGTTDTHPFYNNKNITSIVFDDSSNFTTIGRVAFGGTTNVRGALSIPDTIINIDYGAFNDMSGVTSLTIPNSVMTIGDNAFTGMGLTSLTIPDTITEQRNQNIYSMSKLESLIISDSWADEDMSIGDAFFLKSCFSKTDRPRGCPNNPKIVCRGEINKCKQALEKFGVNGNCTVYADYCIDMSRIQIEEATNQEQCNGGMYEWNSASSKCERLKQESCDISSKYYFNSTANNGVGQCQVIPQTQSACASLTSNDENISWNSTTNTCSRVLPKSVIPSDCYNNGQVFWNNECYDEYPFAKKRWTPAEANEWLHDGDDNFVVLTFKK